MGVELKKASVKKDAQGNEIVEGTKVDFNNVEHFMAVVGTEKSFFEGKTKVVANVLAEKLIKSGKASKSKDQSLVLAQSPDRTVVEVQ